LDWTFREPVGAVWVVSLKKIFMYDEASFVSAGRKKSRYDDCAAAIPENTSSTIKVQSITFVHTFIQILHGDRISLDLF
jgi:hypothetical protein